MTFGLWGLWAPRGVERRVQLLIERKASQPHIVSLNQICPFGMPISWVHIFQIGSYPRRKAAWRFGYMEQITHWGVNPCKLQVNEIISTLRRMDVQIQRRVYPIGRPVWGGVFWPWDHDDYSDVITGFLLFIFRSPSLSHGGQLVFSSWWSTPVSILELVSEWGSGRSSFLVWEMPSAPSRVLPSYEKLPWMYIKHVERSQPEMDRLLQVSNANGMHWNVCCLMKKQKSRL